jgi:Type II secretion system (T2SS), protein M subtype b
VTSELMPRARRIVAFAIFGAVSLTLWFAVFQPIWDSIDTDLENRGIALRALKRNRALLLERSAVQAAAASVERSPRWRNFYQNQTPEAATVQLQTDLRSLFKESNNPTSITAEPAIARGPLTRISVRVTLSVRVDQLADALDRLQKHERQLRVETLIIQAPESQSPQTNPTLSVQAEISALLLASATDKV